jgi:hypothetical protein
MAENLINHFFSPNKVFEHTLTNIFASLVAIVILHTIEGFRIENKVRIKELLLDISSIWQKKSLYTINHPNTPFTYNGKGFVDHS